MNRPLLKALGPRADVMVTLDWETYWDANYSLRKLTTEGYVRDRRFETIGVGVKFGVRPAVWLEEWQFRTWAARVNWARVAVLCHHTQFDGFVLSHHYGIKPRFLLDTMSMARALGHRRVSLEELAPKFGLGHKGKEIDNTRGKRRRNFTPAEWEAFGRYCINDTELTNGLLWKMLPGFPPEELWQVDTTIREFTEPVFVADTGVLETARAGERTKKVTVLRSVAETEGIKIPENATEAQALEATREVLSSNDQFSALLAPMLREFGEEVPMKPGKRGPIPAFAKSDPGFQDLLEHRSDEIRALCEARLTVKSTIIETRTERMLGIASRGAVPFYLKYCLAGTTPVLTERGWVPLSAVQTTDRVWDGGEWVPHGGLVDQGERETWTAHGLTATPDHGFLTETGWTQWGDILSDPTRSRFQSALSSGALPLSLGSPVELPPGADSAGNRSGGVNAAGPDSYIADMYAGGPGQAKGAPIAADEERRLIERRCPTTSSGPEFSHDSAELSPDAQTRRAPRLRTTVAGGSPSSRNGSMTVLRSSPTSKPCPVGNAPISTLTESTTTRAMSPETFVWSPARSIVSTNEKSPSSRNGFAVSKQKTRVYDLSFAGPKNRFTVLTDAGPIIAHNCGAHTHRWSGGDKMNPQNFNRGGALRAAILAPPGHLLAVGDLAQIEARKVAWLAGQNELLDSFRRNDALGEAGDFYSDEGSRFFGRKLSKKDLERQVSKALLLGLGFGMGWGKCALELLKGMLGTPPCQFTAEHVQKFGVDVEAFAERPFGQDKTCGDRVRELVSRLDYDALLIHCAVTDYMVRLYRKTNSRIERLWSTMTEIIKEMESPGPSGKVRMRFGPLEVMRHAIRKPSGLVLHYPGLQRRGKDYGYIGGKSGREWQKIYGGLLTENVVQSLARDVIAEHALWIRAEAAPIRTTTHDEIVAAPREPEADACLGYMLMRMKISPSWCPGLPLKAEGGVARRYVDAK